MRSPVRSSEERKEHVEIPNSYHVLMNAGSDDNNSETNHGYEIMPPDLLAFPPPFPEQQQRPESSSYARRRRINSDDQNFTHCSWPGQRDVGMLNLSQKNDSNGNNDKKTKSELVEFALKEALSVLLYCLTSTFLKIILEVLCDLANNHRNFLLSGFATLILKVFPQNVLQRSAPGFVTAQVVLLLFIQKHQNNVDFKKGEENNNSKNNNNNNSNNNKLDKHENQGIFANLSIRICEYRMGRLKHSKGDLGLVVLIHVAVTLVFYTCLFVLGDPKALLLLKTTTTTADSTSSSSGSDDAVDSSYAASYLQYSNDPQFVLLDLLQEFVVTTCFTVGILVVPVLLSINKLSPWFVFFFFYPLYNMSVDHTNYNDNDHFGKASCISPAILISHAMIGAVVVRTASTWWLWLRVIPQVAGGFAAGIIMLRYFPDCDEDATATTTPS